SLLGTPAYMAPEQARRGPDLSPAADVFSLGCVLFECATGRRAFVGEHPMAVLAKVLLEEAPRARELAYEVPAALDELLAEMLSKEPAARPADASRVAEALARIEDGAAESCSFRGPATLGAREAEIVSVALAAPPKVAAFDA